MFTQQAENIIPNAVGTTPLQLWLNKATRVWFFPFIEWLAEHVLVFVRALYYYCIVKGFTTLNFPHPCTTNATTVMEAAVSQHLSESVPCKTQPWDSCWHTATYIHKAFSCLRPWSHSARLWICENILLFIQTDAMEVTLPFWFLEVARSALADNWNDTSLGGLNVDHICERMIKNWPNTGLYSIPVGSKLHEVPTCQRLPKNCNSRPFLTLCQGFQDKLERSVFIWWWYRTLKETVKESTIQYLTIPKCLQIIWSERDPYHARTCIGWKVTFLLYFLCHFGVTWNEDEMEATATKSGGMYYVRSCF